MKRELYKINGAIQEFTGYSVRGSSRNVKKYRVGLREKKKLARMMFYKYGLEKGIHYKKLMSFTGDKQHFSIYRLRRDFNRLLSSSEMSNLYNRFLVYIEDLETT